MPTSSAFSRFLSKLPDIEAEINGIFRQLVKELIELLPDFGENLSIDGKAIRTHAKAHQESKPDDGRRDNDADYVVKTYRGKSEDGTKWEKIKSWFGYNLHLIVDTNYELPVAFSVTKASAAEAPVARRLLGQMEQSEPALLERCKYFTALLESSRMNVSGCRSIQCHDHMHTAVCRLSASSSVSPVADQEKGSALKTDLLVLSDEAKLMRLRENDDDNHEGLSKKVGLNNELSKEELKEVRDLQVRDRQVRAHEQAHVSASGLIATSAPNYEFEI